VGRKKSLGRERVASSSLKGLRGSVGSTVRGNKRALIDQRNIVVAFKKRGD